MPKQAEPLHLTHKQQRYIIERVSGKSQIESYKTVYDADNMSDASIAVAATRLDANAKIAPLLAKHFQHAAQIAATRSGVTLAKIAERAWDISAENGRDRVPALAVATAALKTTDERPNQTLVLSGLSDEQIEAAIKRLGGGG